MKNCKGYYDIEIDKNDFSNINSNYLDYNGKIKENLMKVRVAFIKRKIMFDNEIIVSIRMINWNDSNNITIVLQEY